MVTELTYESQNLCFPSPDNLIAEQFVQITTAYYEGNYTAWPLVAQRQLEGMFAFVSIPLNPRPLNIREIQNPSDTV